MVWDQNVSVVVMLTTLADMGLVGDTTVCADTVYTVQCVCVCAVLQLIY